MIRRLLLKIAMRVIQEVLSEIVRQMDVLQREVEERLVEFVRTVVNGAWTGPDAERFINEVNSLIMPRTRQNIAAIQSLQKGVETAVNTINEADQVANGMVGELESVFSKVY